MLTVTSIAGLTGTVTAEQLSALITPTETLTPDPDDPGFFLIGAN
jgi:hypothetical protein